MGECARCNDFTDNPASGEYPYCDDCLDDFDQIRQEGVVVQQRNGGYQITVTDPNTKYEGGYEQNQTDALARGKYISDSLGTSALLEYTRTGSQWEVENFLSEHPDIRKDVMKRLNRVPEKSESGLLGRIKKLVR